MVKKKYSISAVYTATHIKNNLYTYWIHNNNKYILHCCRLVIPTFYGSYCRPKEREKYLAKDDNFKTAHFPDVPINNVLNSKLSSLYIL